MSSENFIGQAEMRDVGREFRSMIWIAGFFSVFVNILMLTGPLFMLQTYDRVLGARSEATLLALFVMVAFLYAVMGLLDWARARLMVRLGARFQARLDRRVFAAMLFRAVSDHRLDEKTGGGQQLKDLEAINRYYSSPVFLALFDLPWVPVFLLGIGLFHPWLGILGVVGGGLLVAFAAFNQITTRVPSVKSTVSTFASDRYSDQLQNEAETIRSLGMQNNAFDKWYQARQRAQVQGLRASDLSGNFSALSRTFRQFLQSCMLALGAYLVLQGAVTPGVMIASSILMGRALSPIETIVNQWSVVQRSRRAWDNIAQLFAEVPEGSKTLDLPRPRARLTVDQITVTPPRAGSPTLRQISFEINPGEAVGVIGPSGSGKSTLARALTGVWPVANGQIKLDGAPLDQYNPEKLAEYIGYLPQRVSLFDGTVAENIARLSSGYESDRVVAAAQRAAAHDMILRLPQGYNTPVQTIGTQLSGGQIQRIGLARALYGEPVLLVLDEPNSSLDNEGSIALNKAVLAMKAEGKAVLIMAHRPAAIKECDHLLVLEDGKRRAWGPREEVMSSMLSNVETIRRTLVRGGGVS